MVFIIYIRIFLTLTFLYIVLTSTACGPEEEHKIEDLDTLKGMIVDKRETDHEPYQILVVPNTTKDDSENKSKNEKQNIASRNNGSWFTVSSKTYKDLKTGDHAKVYFDSDAVLESNPPQMWAEEIIVTSD